MFLHQGTQVLINSTNVVTSEPHLQDVVNLEVPYHSIITISTRKSGICTSKEPCVYEIQVTEIQSPQLILLIAIHLKNKAEID